MAEPAIDKQKQHDRIVDVLKGIYDPEIPVSIYELGLIYGIEVGDDGQVAITMTLTSPACPEAQNLPPTVENEVLVVPGVEGVSVEVVWDPPWGPELMSEAARLALGF